jgi:hypothetical protein
MLVAVDGMNGNGLRSYHDAGKCSVRYPTIHIPWGSRLYDGAFSRRVAYCYSISDFNRSRITIIPLGNCRDILMQHTNHPERNSLEGVSRAA